MTFIPDGELTPQRQKATGTVNTAHTKVIDREDYSSLMESFSSVPGVGQSSLVTSSPTFSATEQKDLSAVYNKNSHNLDDYGYSYNNSENTSPIKDKMSLYYRIAMPVSALGLETVSSLFSSGYFATMEAAVLSFATASITNSVSSQRLKAITIPSAIVATDIITGLSSTEAFTGAIIGAGAFLVASVVSKVKFGRVISVTDLKSKVRKVITGGAIGILSLSVLGNMATGAHSIAKVASTAVAVSATTPLPSPPPMPIETATSVLAVEEATDTLYQSNPLKWIELREIAVQKNIDEAVKMEQTAQVKNNIDFYHIQQKVLQNMKLEFSSGKI